MNELYLGYFIKEKVIGLYFDICQRYNHKKPLTRYAEGSDITCGQPVYKKAEKVP